MESERKINWLGLFIKVIIIFIFALIIIWLISKIINKNKLSEIFEKNINNMEKVAVDYFKNVDLPLDKGDSLKITLEELIQKELIVSTGNAPEKNCNTKKSFSKITRGKDKYIVETTLECGREKNTIEKNFMFEDCKNCNQSTSTEPNINGSEENNNNPNATSNNASTGITYYEYVKETTSYTKWMRGSLKGNNIENKYEYYAVDYDTYHTLGVIPAGKKAITYILKLNTVPNEKYYFTTVEEVNDFDISEENNYLNEKKVSIYKGNKVNLSSDDISVYSLTESNFTYKLSPYYRNGNFYIRVMVNLNNTDNVKTYYDNKLKGDSYLIPLKINVKFASNKITDTKPNGEYETISYYRYVTINRETIWSKETYVEGYKKTGKIKVQ